MCGWLAQRTAGSGGYGELAATVSIVPGGNQRRCMQRRQFTCGVTRTAPHCWVATFGRARDRLHDRTGTVQRRGRHYSQYLSRSQSPQRSGRSQFSAVTDDVSMRAASHQGRIRRGTIRSAQHQHDDRPHAGAQPLPRAPFRLSGSFVPSLLVTSARGVTTTGAGTAGAALVGRQHRRAMRPRGGRRGLTFGSEHRSTGEVHTCGVTTAG
jgi:hypothetical protein